MKKSQLKFDLQLDDNNLPHKITMNSDDKQAEDIDLKSIMIAAWDAKKMETLRVDLWTKEMMVNEMYIMFHQTLLSMASTLEKSTGNEKMSSALSDYCEFFAEQTKIVNSN